jgi:predicted dehydrogenase
MEPLRVGIVGCGVICWTHGEALKRLADEGMARVAGATDLVPERAAEFTARYGGRTFDSYADMLASDEIDTVTLCTPSGLHGEMAVQAAKARKHVLSEKPLDVYLEAADAAIMATRAAGVTYGGIFQKRYAPAFRKVRQAIERGAFGDIVLACTETKWYRGQSYYDSGDWRGTWKLDAGVFSNQGVHQLDTVQFLAGDVAEILSATLTPGYHRDIEAETLGVATMRFENGALGTMAMTTLSYNGFSERTDICGTKGSALLIGEKLAEFRTEDPYEDEYGDLSQPQPGDKSGSRDPRAIGGEGHYLNIKDFLLAVREGREPYASAAEARRAVKLLNMLYAKAGVGPFAGSH